MDCLRCGKGLGACTRTYKRLEVGSVQLQFNLALIRSNNYHEGPERQCNDDFSQEQENRRGLSVKKIKTRREKIDGVARQDGRSG